ncbi:MAG TPA: hypothetical protein VMT53_27725 [Terriglobales bacterium]|nr:hypothetical protein [Terriglobales bacterium]
MTRRTLRSTFSVFPDGLPGAGLVLLRGIAGAALVHSGSVQFILWREPKAFTLILGVLSVLCGLLLLLGLFTSVVCSLGALISLGTVLSRMPFPRLTITPSELSAVFTGAIAVALLCLGPGAYSLDARRRGRREIIIPARPRSSK